MAKKTEEQILAIRPLRAEEIECRVATINAKGYSILLYKDARVDMRLLDEVFGPMGWKREHQLIGDRLYCTISIWDETKKEWISKQDVGTESYTEKEKGQASDAFKRAGFNWGIGRELYTAPYIWIKAKPGEITERNGKPSTYTKLSVVDIKYNEDKEIIGLALADEDLICRYSYGETKYKVTPSSAPAGVYKGSELKKAVEEMKACKTKADINSTWSKYKAMQNEDDFKNACREACEKLR